MKFLWILPILVFLSLLNWSFILNLKTKCDLCKKRYRYNDLRQIVTGFGGLGEIVLVCKNCCGNTRKVMGNLLQEQKKPVKTRSQLPN